ncbi:D-alanyl-D-alanine carboxypeptidase family protein [Micavibrio aeruginosavorus]|uniref:D-alanyl-D-alanine carboxypeptidase family protein n=1 Tax=Micavibrio aeruginosavorus TaxID=349221 RepID=UPI003F4A87BA
MGYDVANTRKHARAIFSAALGLVLGLGLMAATPAHAAKKKSQDNPRYASIVMDADTGAILHERYADKSLYPASLVKMMTLLMVFEAMDRGEMNLNTRIRISKHAASMQPSKIGLKAGSTIRVEDAIRALVTKSANDMAAALGEAVGGSESNFASMMTRRAHEIGMRNTTFRNASGLHHPAQTSTVRDMALLSRHIIYSQPRNFRFFSTKNFRYNGVNYHNHNRLMETYKGMDGMKTGYTVPSGFNLAATAVRGDRRLIAVVFGGRTTQSRNAHVADLLDRGFKQIGTGQVMMANTDTRATAPAPVPNRKPGTETTNTVVAATHFEEMMGAGDSDPGASTRIESGMVAVNALRSAGAVSRAEPQQPVHPQVIRTPAAQASLQPQQQPVQQPQTVTTTAPIVASGAEQTWSVQIGAFTNRMKTDQLLNNSQGKLPPQLAQVAQPVIVPLSAGSSTVFRARIKGFSRNQAIEACRYFTDCMTISPRAF